MNITFSSGIKIIFSSLLLVVVAGCATSPKTPIYASPELRPNSIAEITLLPVVDARADKSIKLNLDKTMRSWVKSILERDHYHVQLAPFSDTEQSSIDEDFLKNADATWVKALGSVDERYIMIVMVDDFRSKIGFGDTASAEVSGALFDKENGTMLWRDRGIGREGTIGFLGWAFAGSDRMMALDESCMDLMRSFPKRSRN